MFKKHLLKSLLLIFSFNIISAQIAKSDTYQTSSGAIIIQPITHGSLVLTINNKTIYVDPYGGIANYKDLKKPDIILITDIHGDHLDFKTLDSIDISNTIIITPKAVEEKLPKKYKSAVITLNNKQGVHRFDLFIEAIAMYNLPENPPSPKHPKGRGNGYIISLNDTKIYISGDSEDIPEMRALQNIDIAFVCMNLPYTMDIHQAASAVLEFRPKIVYPYHYRGTNGLSDINAFKNLVNSTNEQIEVRLKDWYPKN